MRKILTTAILIVVGLLVLAGYLFSDFLTPVLAVVLNWGLVVLGAAMLIGIGYLLRTQFINLFTGENRAGLSAITLIGFFFTLISGLILSTQNDFFSDLILNIQIPVEASLVALLGLVLFTTSLRLIRIQGWTALSISFLLSAVTVLVLDSEVFQIVPGSAGAQVISFLRRLPLAGARGILLGIALGGLLVGLRVLLTIDRPFGEE